MFAGVGMKHMLVKFLSAERPERQPGPLQARGHRPSTNRSLSVEPLPRILRRMRAMVNFLASHTLEGTSLYRGRPVVAPAIINCHPHCSLDILLWTSRSLGDLVCDVWKALGAPISRQMTFEFVYLQSGAILAQALARQRHHRASPASC